MDYRGYWEGKFIDGGNAVIHGASYSIEHNFGRAQDLAVAAGFEFVNPVYDGGNTVTVTLRKRTEKGIYTHCKFPR